MAEAVVVQRTAFAQRYADHRLLGRRGRLGDRLGHLAGRAMAQTRTALALAPHAVRPPCPARRLPGRRGRLGDRLGHLAGLAMAETRTALAVADHDERREAET